MGLTDKKIFALLRLFDTSTGLSMCRDSTMAEYVESNAVAVNAINGTLATASNAPIFSNCGRNSHPLVLHTFTDYWEQPTLLILPYSNAVGFIDSHEYQISLDILITQ